MSWLSESFGSGLKMVGDLFGGGDIKFPGMSPEEREYLQAQLDILEQQGEDAAAMKPFLLQSMGLIEENGEIRRMTEDEILAGMTEPQRRQYDITKMAQERQMKAYAGELPISPALEQSLQDQYKQLAESLSQRLGPDWMTTTPGQQAMMRFTQKADLVREEARRGEIAGGTGATLSNLAYMGGADASKASFAAGFPGRTTGMMSGYGGILDRMSNERMMKYQAQTQQQAGMMGGLGALVGSGIQAYGTYAGLTAASSRKLKENIETIESPIEKIMEIRGVDFDWKVNGQNVTGEHDVGVIAEEVEMVIPEAVTEINGVKHVYYYKILPLLIEGIKTQSNQIESLKKSIDEIKKRDRK